MDEGRIQRAGFFYYLGIAIQSVIIVGSLYADVKGFSPNFPWQYVAIITFVLFLFQTVWKMYQLEQYALSMATNISLSHVREKDIGIITKGSILLSPKGETVKLRESYFAAVVFRNAPKNGTERNHANNVWATLTYYDKKRKLLIGPIDGRWSGSEHPITPKDKQVLLRRRIRSDGSNETLDVAMKPYGQEKWYAYNNDNYFFENMVDDTHLLLPSLVNVRITLSGERVKKSFWVRIRNIPEKGIQAEKLNCFTRWLP